MLPHAVREPQVDAHQPRARRAVVLEDANRHFDGRAVVLYRGRSPGGGVTAGDAVMHDAFLVARPRLRRRAPARG